MINCNTQILIRTQLFHLILLILRMLWNVDQPICQYQERTSSIEMTIKWIFLVETSTLTYTSYTWSDWTKWCQEFNFTTLKQCGHPFILRSHADCRYLEYFSSKSGQIVYWCGMFLWHVNSKCQFMQYGALQETCAVCIPLECLSCAFVPFTGIYTSTIHGFKVFLDYTIPFKWCLLEWKKTLRASYIVTN